MPKGAALNQQTNTLADLKAAMDQNAKASVEAAKAPTESKSQPDLLAPQNLPEKRHYDDYITAYVKYTQNHESTEKVRKWVAVSNIAAALERKVWLDRGYYTLFPNLYTFIIGPSGIIRKSTTTAIGVDLLRDLETLNIMSDRLTAASVIEQLAKSQKTFSCNGEMMQQSAVFSYASELVVLLTEVYGSISELLTTFYDCIPHDWRKPWVYENKSQGRVEIPGPCLNILGASTPIWLERAIPASEMEGGFSSRVLFVCENSPPPKFIAWPKITKEMKEMRPKLLDDLRRINALTGAFTVGEHAYEWFEEYYKQHQQSLLTHKDARFSGYAGRKPDTLLKVAMALSASRGEDLCLTTQDLERAGLWLDELELTMFEAFEASGKNEFVREIHSIMRSLKKSGSMTHQQLLRIYGKDVSHENMIKIMTHLHQQGCVRILKQQGTLQYVWIPQLSD